MLHLFKNSNTGLNPFIIAFCELKILGLLFVCKIHKLIHLQFIFYYTCLMYNKYIKQ